MAINSLSCEIGKAIAEALGLKDVRKLVIVIETEEPVMVYSQSYLSRDQDETIAKVVKGFTVQPVTDVDVDDQCNVAYAPVK